MEKAVMPAVLAVILILTVSAVYCLTESPGGSSDGTDFDDSDVVGHWYLVSCGGYTQTGGYQAFGADNPRAMTFDLDINYERYGMFFGFFRGTEVTGSVDTGVIDLQISVGDTVARMRGHQIDADTMVLTAITYTTEGSTGVATSSVNIYSKDGTAVYPLPAASVDIDGSWACAEATLYTAAAANSLTPVGSLTLEQKDAVFFGTMTAPLSGATEVASLAGSFSCFSTRSAGLAAGFNDSEGRYWFMQVSGDSLSIWTFCETDGEIGCLARTYVRNGAAPAVAVQAADAAGTVWNCAYFRTLNGTDAQVTAMPCAITVDRQYGNVLFLTMDRNGVSIPCVGLLRGGGVVRLTGSTLEDGQLHPAYGLCTDATHANVIFFDKENTESYACVRNDGGTYDAIGHWYNAGLTGYYSDGAYWASVPLPLRQPFELDILSVKGLAFYGYFAGTPISGYAVGNTYSFTATINGFTANVLCTVTDEQTMTVAESYTDLATGENSVWSVLMKKQYTDDGITPLATTYDYGGDWQLVGGYAYDGTHQVVLADSTLHITEVHGNVFAGTMQRTLDGKVTQVSIHGVIRGDTGKAIMGSLVEEHGYLYSVIITGGQLYIYAVGSTDLTADQTYGAMTLVYSRDGTGTMPTGPGAGIVGESWKQVSCQIMTADGSFSTTVQDTHFTIVGVDGTLYYSTGVYAGRAGSSMGYLDGAYTSFAMRLDGGTVANLGYGYLDNGQLTLMTFLRDTATGYMMTVIATYERV